MIVCKRMVFFIFIALVGCGIIYLILYDPYSFDEVKKAKLKADLCDKESIAYLGDYFEKRGLQSEIHNLINLYEKCTKFKDISQPPNETERR